MSLGTEISRPRGLTARRLKSGIEIRPLHGSLDGAEIRLWDTVVSGLVEYAYAGRPCCLVEINNTDVLLDYLKIPVGYMSPDGGLFFGFVPRCSEALLREVTADANFQVGWLWLTSLPARVPERFERFVRAVDASQRFHEVPATTEELMLTACDGECLWWLNPSATLDSIAERLQQLTEAVGWTFNSVLLHI